MPLDLTDDKSALVQVMAWCRQATSHYLSQCWPICMLPNGVTRPQWVKDWQPYMEIWGGPNLQMSYSDLTHWGRVTHICVNKPTIIGSDNGLSPGLCQAILGTNVVRLLIGTLVTHLNEIVSEIHTFSFKKMHLKMSSAKWRQLCLGLNWFKYTRIVNLVMAAMVTWPN